MDTKRMFELADKHLMAFTKRQPVALVRGEGSRVWDSDGKMYLDFTGGISVTALGHSHPKVVGTLREQAATLLHVSNIFHIPQQAQLAALLCDHSFADRVFFSNSGAEANETAIKLARSYHKARGNARKVKVISRARAYHGATYGTLSATRLRQYHEHVSPLMEGFVEAPAPYRYRCETCATLPACTEACADAVDALIRREGPDTVAMVIGEPVQAAGGIIVPPDSYWPRLREICREHDVLLVADEVICGFGRTGRWFGVDNWAVVPDMLTIGKGLTSGYMPLSGVAVGGEIYDVLTTRPEEFTFWQGFTYNAHPGCCAAALQTIEILDKENLVEHAQRMGRRLVDRLRPLESSPIVGEVRGLGLLTGVEIVADRKTRAPFPDGRGSATVRRHCLEAGLIVRSISDTIAMAPPLVISESEIDHVADVVTTAVRRTEVELGRS